MTESASKVRDRERATEHRLSETQFSTPRGVEKLVEIPWNARGGGIHKAAEPHQEKMFVWGFGDYINVHLGNMARPPRFFHIISLLLFNIFFHCVDKKEEQNSRIFHALFVSCLTSFHFFFFFFYLMVVVVVVEWKWSDAKRSKGNFFHSRWWRCSFSWRRDDLHWDFKRRSHSQSHPISPNGIDFYPHWINNETVIKNQLFIPLPLTFALLTSSCSPPDY